MAPFLGVVAAEPGQQPVSAIVSGSYGGNLVLRDLGVGSHLFLPVAKPGGRMWTGDVHALQGDGVVDQTAIETAAEDLQIRYDLHKQVGLRGPLGETGTAWIVVAFAASLDDALVACLREVIYWLPAAAGITGPETPPHRRLLAHHQTHRRAGGGLDETPAQAYLSANRTCEMGLRQATGRPYESFVFLLEELTRPT